MNLRAHASPWLIATLGFGWCAWCSAQDSSNAAFLEHFPQDFVHQYPQGTQSRQITDVKRMLDAKMPVLLAAFNQARGHDPALQGEMDVALAVAPGGEVVAARTVHNTLRDVQLRSTILDTLQQMSFGPATGSGYYLLWYPLVFQQGQAQVTPATAPEPPNSTTQAATPAVAANGREQEMQQALRAELSPPSPTTTPPAVSGSTKPGSAQWVSSIAAAIERQWRRPVNSPVDFQCIVNLEILPTGRIAAASIKQGTQNLALDQSILAAVHASDPLPMPVNPATYAPDVSIVFHSR